MRRRTARRRQGQDIDFEVERCEKHPRIDTHAEAGSSNRRRDNGRGRRRRHPDALRPVNYFAAFGTVLGVNLLPAFAPPTWAVLVFFRLQSGLNPVVLVLEGAVAATLGRSLLALGCRRFRSRIPAERIANLGAAKEALTQTKAGPLAGGALFAVSPLPSAQLWEAAGLVDVPLRPLALAFFSGRLVSYSVSVAGASAVKHTDFGQVLVSSFKSPVGLVVQLAMLGGVFALDRVDWAKLAHHAGRL